MERLALTRAAEEFVAYHGFNLHREASDSSS
jgi:hypothetical protein